MKLSEDMIANIHVALGEASMCWKPRPSDQEFDSSKAKEIGDDLCAYLAASTSNDACGDALQKLWDEVLVAHRPTYGDWEYPGQAYRHLKAEYEAIRKAAKELAEYALASSLVNTSDYLSGLGDKINTLATALNEDNRAVYDQSEGRFYLRPCHEKAHGRKLAK